MRHYTAGSDAHPPHNGKERTVLCLAPARKSQLRRVRPSFHVDALTASVSSACVRAMSTVPSSSSPPHILHSRQRSLMRVSGITSLLKLAHVFAGCGAPAADGRDPERGVEAVVGDGDVV